MPPQDPHLSSSGIRTGRIRAQIASSQDGGWRKELRKRGRLEEKARRGTACATLTLQKIKQNGNITFYI
jgi:hypothetical protein